MKWDNDHTTGLLFIIGAVVIVATLFTMIGKLTLINRQSDAAMLAMGYCKTPLMGTSRLEWHPCACTLQGGDLTTIDDGAGTLTVSGPSNLSK